eukprot:m.56830 g.56830  ORF g.56830 m.56830 type:complete len:363 (+) comp11062_c0_seq1:320-1408(+)
MNAEFMQAIADGNATVVKRFVEEEAIDLDGGESGYKPPAPTDVAPPVLDHNGLQLCAPDDVRYVSPLNWAVFAGQRRTAEYLATKAGANPDGPSGDGRRPLHVAVSKGLADMICMFVERCSANVNAGNFAGETPLYHALYFKKEDICSYLLEHGAEPNLATVHGFTSLHMAASRGLTDAATKIIKKVPEIIDIQSKDGATALQLAAMCGFLPIVQLLVKAGADLKATDSKGNTALRLAVLQSSKAEQAGVALWLLGMHPELANDKNETDDEELIHIACSLSCTPDIAVALIEGGCSISGLNGDGQSPLHNASFNGQASIVEALVKAKADVNQKDSDGETPLFYADLGGYDEIVSFLESCGGL